MGVVAFTGTDTGRVYNVGQSYVSAGRVYTAQADGSFSRPNSDGSIGFSEGSSRSETARFYVSNSLASGGSRPAAFSGPSGSVVSGRPGVPASAVAARPPGAGPGVVAAVQQSTAGGADMFASYFASRGMPGASFVQRSDGTYDAEMVQWLPIASMPAVTLRTTQLWAGGVPMSLEYKTSDVAPAQQRYGDDNWVVSTLGAAAVGASDLGVLGGRGLGAAVPAVESMFHTPALPDNYQSDPWGVGGWLPR